MKTSEPGFGLHDSLSWYGISTKDIRLSPDVASAKFEVHLTSVPDLDVAFNIEQVDGEDAAVQLSVTPAKLLFTPENWQTPQAISVSTSAMSDHHISGHQTSDVTTSLRILPTTDVLNMPTLHRIGITSWSALYMFLAFALVCLLFYFSFSVFVIPYSGLGIELTDDYSERTNLQIYRLVAVTFRAISVILYRPFSGGSERFIPC